VAVAGESEAGGGPLTVQQAYEQMMRKQAAPALHALGFSGTFRAFRFRSGGHHGEVRWQKSRHNSRQHLRFTAHVFYWWGYSRISQLMPEPTTDVWWELRGGEPTDPVADSVVATIRRYALPAILAGLDDLDRQQDPAVRWARAFPPVPDISTRLPDRGGINRDAWFVRAAGTDADESFADFASDIAVRRLFAAQYVAEHARSDPRTLPALLNRLEHDPCPVIRTVIAGRMLTVVAHDPQVRSALQATAAYDEDPVARWAARYALRVDLRPETESQPLPDPSLTQPSSP
jgi:hypothetical protein